ncbi:MAG TPA: HNH endonuclease [Actinospica sp.]|nr:HNH endonuclease [Actinospica sp.]
MDWIGRIEQLRRWTRNGERAPHKPLLLLFALGRYQADGGAPVRFSEAEGQLNDLLAEFGPPRKSSPGYPFHHLASDGLWVVRTSEGGSSPGPNLGDLRGSGAEGSLSPELIDALNSDSHLLAQLARVLLDSNFEPSLHADICALAGLDLEAAETAAPVVGPEQRRRSPTFRREVLMAYEYQCAFCGYDGALGRVSAGLDAAHVKWWAMHGPDTIDNGVCLCSLHHKLFDMGVLGVTEDWRISVSGNFVGRSATARAHVLSLGGQPATPPQALYSHPKPEYITWHQHEVFKHPARKSAPIG